VTSRGAGRVDPITISNRCSLVKSLYGKSCRVLRAEPFVAGQGLLPLTTDSGVYNLDAQSGSLELLSSTPFIGDDVILAAGDVTYLLGGSILTEASLINLTDGDEVDVAGLPGRVGTEYAAGLSDGIAVLVTFEEAQFVDGSGQVNRVRAVDLLTGASLWTWDMLPRPLPEAFASESLRPWGLRTNPSRDRVLLQVGGDESTASLVAVIDERGLILLEPVFTQPDGDPPFVMTDDRSVPPFTAANAGWFDDDHWLYDDAQELYLVNADSLEPTPLAADRVDLPGQLVAVGDGEHVLTLDKGRITLASVLEATNQTVLAEGCTFLRTEQFAPSVQILESLGP